MWLARDVPDRVERLVLCCTSALLGPPEDWQERAQTVREPRRRRRSPTPVLERWFTPELHGAQPQARRRSAALLRATPREGYAACCEAIRDMDLRDAARRDHGADARASRAPTIPSTPPCRAKLLAERDPDAR